MRYIRNIVGSNPIFRTSETGACQVRKQRCYGHGSNAQYKDSPVGQPRTNIIFFERNDGLVNTLTNKKLELDVSDVQHGYFKARAAFLEDRNSFLKIQVAHEKVKTYYDLNASGDWETFPLQFGSGKYTITLYKKVVAISYTKIGKVHFTANILNEVEPYRHFNQYVQRCDELSTEAADLLVEGDPLKTAINVMNHVRNKYAYDYVKAATVKKNVLPDVFECWRTKLGICQDIAALTASMLRFLNVPAKLVIGYAKRGKNSYYHAWVDILIDETVIRFDPFSKGQSTEYIAERWY